MKRTRNITGNSLATVIFFTLLVAGTIFTLAAALTGHLQLVTAQGNRSQALLCADSAIYQAVADLKADPDFAGEVSYRPAQAPAGVVMEGSLTFEAKEGPYATNNIRSAGSVGGFSQTVVPAKTVHLVAVGRCANRTVVREAFLHFPPFPYALASSGPVETSGTLVGSLPGLEVLAEGLPEEILPGHLVAGGDVVVGPGTEVKGDARSAAAVRLTGGVVRGQVAEHTALDPLPTIEVGAYDPAVDDYVEHLPTSYYGAPLRLANSRARYQGGDPLMLGNGLELDNALLFVDGDLEITGGVRGHGAIVCTGKVTISGGPSSLDGQLTALVAGGDVTLRNGTFQGLVYTEGTFSADGVSILGSFVAAGADSSVRVVDSQVYYTPEATSVTVAATRPQVPAVGGGAVKALDEAGVAIVEPESAEAFQGSDGSYTWDPGQIRIRYQGKEYLTPADVPFTDAQVRFYLEQRYITVSDAWQTFVQRLETGSETLFSLDLNGFFSEADRMELLLWRDLER